MVARYVVGFVFTILFPSNSFTEEDLTTSGKYVQVSFFIFDCNLTRKVCYILTSNHFECLNFSNVVSLR